MIYTHVLTDLELASAVPWTKAPCSPESLRGSLRSELLGHKDVSTHSTALRAG